MTTASGMRHRLSTIRTRHMHKVLALVVALIVVACGLFVVLDAFRTKFHYEIALDESPTNRFDIRFGRLQDTNVTILLTNNTDKVLSVDIELFNRSTSFEVQYIPGERFWAFGSSEMWSFGQMKSLYAVIYAPAVFNLGVHGKNLTTTVRFDRSATFIERGPEYGADLGVYIQHTGICTFVLDECVGLSDVYVEVEIGFQSVSLMPRTAFVYVDLPSDAEGRLHVNEEKIVFHTLDGWWYRGGGLYSTSSNPPSTNIDIGCLADMTHAWLYD